MKKLILLAVVSVVLALIAACGAAQPETVKVVETVIVEKEVEKEVEKIVTVQVEKEVEKIVTVQVEKEVVKEPLIVRVAFPSTIDIDDVAALLAFEKMQDEGFAVAPTFYAQGELAAAAVAGGQADFGVGASTIWLTAIQKGAPIVGIMEQTANGWSVVSIKDIKECKDLAGKRLAIHSEGSVSTAMLKAWIDTTCKGTEPEWLVIPGSENRAAAILAGEIDATPAEMIDSVKILTERPDDFQRIADFAKDLPDLKTGGFWVRTDFTKENPEAVKSFIRNVLEIHRQINDDPKWFGEQVPRFLAMEDKDIELLPKIIEALLSIDNYPVNGGMTPENAQGTIDFFTDSGRLEAGLMADKAFDLTFLDAVLEEIGKR
ncbi:MAG: ABC transporter substrate-binding protein [Anaerolineae bacterium]